MATDLLNSGYGDEGRLRFILDCINKDKHLYKTDIKFLESMTEKLEERIKTLRGNKDEQSVKSQKERHPRTLISDEQLDEIINSENTKTKKIHVRKKSFIARLFSK